MFNISTIISLCAAVLAILYSIGIFRNIRKEPEGNKKIIDSVKDTITETKKTLGGQNSTLSAISAPVFVLILYLINWQTALGFLVGLLATTAINIAITNMVAQNNGRVVEALRKGLPTGANLALKSGTASAVLSLGVGLFISAGFYAIFQDIHSLIGVGLGVSLAVLFYRLSKKGSTGSRININTSISFFELCVLATIVTMFLGREMFSKSINPTLFPLILISAQTVTFALTSFFIRFFKKTDKFTTVLFRALGIETALFALAAYFSFNWIMKNIGINSIINFYGLTLLSMIILFLAGMAILLNIYYQITNNAVMIAEKSEMPEDTKKHFFKMSIYEKISGKILNLYSIKSTAFISVAIFAAYNRSIAKSFALDLTNYLVLVGLFVGLVFISIIYWQKIKFNFESINKNILVTVCIVLLPVIIGLTLGPIALGGYFIGVLLTGLFASIFLCQSFANIVRVSALIALLIASSIV